MSILIADSGASKTQWVLCQKQQDSRFFSSIGCNPNAVSHDLIQEALWNLSTDIQTPTDISDLYFYGSGVVDTHGIATMEGLFAPVFPKARLHFDSDLVGAVRSTGRDKGIVGILGTGSNACYFQHSRIIDNRGGHGYLVGDEGSGQDLGKALLRGLLYGSLPDQLKEYVLEKEQRTLHDLKMGVYKSERPSAYLADLARYLHPFQEEGAVRQMIQSRFTVFLQTTILHLPFVRELPIDTVGSIGFYFREIWKESCQKLGLIVGKSIQNPLEGLISFHHQG